ncbi:MAG: GNAT family N-acetyltransferase [Kiritimatiellaeota bacterium]|nr:GNAT family N-acetyltransferase [Kiritimatiellota bacterium]
MKITIRKGIMEDIGELIELLYELFSVEHDFTFDKEKQYQGIRLMLSDSDHRRIWVAEREDGRIVGMCAIQVLISTAEGGEVGLIEDIVVTKHLRCQGIGRQLLNTLEGWAKERGLLRLQLLTDKTNLPSIQFYKKMKWQSTQLVCMRH